MKLQDRTCARLHTYVQGRTLFLLCWTAYAAAYIGRYNYSAVMGAIISEGVLSLSSAGAISTGYFILYATGQIVSGLISQKISPYTMIFAGLALSGGCNFGMAWLPSGVMPLLWAANGFFQAMVWPPIVRLFAECLPLAQQKKACVNISSTTPVGTLISYGLSAILLSVATWHTVFWGCGIVLLAAAILWLLGTAPLRSLMGTRSYIGKDIGNGKYSVIFCQLESYLETTGRLLTEHYNTPEKVDALLALGDICFLGEKIEPDPSLPHDWYGKDYQQDVTLAFGRDCGEYKWPAKEMTLVCPSRFRGQ